MQASLYLSLLFFGIYILSIVTGLRTVKKISPTTIVCGNGLIVYFIALGFIILLDQPVNFFSFSSFYWFLTLSLLMFFGAIYKSISLRIMAHLLNKPKKTDLLESILETYIKDQSYINRVEILLDKKMIHKLTDASFGLTEKGYALAKKLSFIQKMFSIKESG